jgi:hypothetical protein
MIAEAPPAPWSSGSMPIAGITIGERTRQEMGDLGELVQARP